MKKILSAVLLVALVFSLAACGDKQTETKTEDKNPAIGKDTITEQITENVPADPDLLAVMNGKEIRKADIESTTKLLSYVYSLEGQEADLSMIETYALQYYITSEIYNKKLEEYNLTVSDEEVQAQFDTIVSEYEGGIETLEAGAKEAGVSIDELKSIIRSDLAYSKVEDHLTKDINITDEDCKKYYDEHPEEFVTPARRDFNQITYETEEEAKMAISAIQSGTSFDELATARNGVIGADENGTMATVANGELATEFNDIVFSLTEGQVYETPIKTEKGYHVVMANNFTESETLAYEDILEDLKEYLRAAEADTILSEMFNKAYEDLGIEMYASTSPIVETTTESVAE